MTHLQSAARTAALAIAVGLATTLRSPGAETLDLRFDDPMTLLDGMASSTRLSAPLTKATATVASGNGGRAVLQILTKAPQESVEAQGFAKITDPAAGVRVRFEKTSQCAELGVGILPEENAASVAIAASKGGFYEFNGGLDFFVRVNSEGESPRFNFWAWIGPMSFALRLNPRPEEGLSAQVSTRGAVLRLPDNDKGQPLVGSKMAVPIPFEIGEVMHVAVVFETTEEGLVTIRIFAQKGTGPMETNSNTLNAEIGPFLLPVSPETESAKTRYALKLSKAPVSQTLDVFRLRIFEPAPAVFPGLD